MVNRVILDANMIRVSKPGVDVLTASDAQPDNFLLKEGAQNLGIFFTGQALLLANEGTGTTAYGGQEIMYPYPLPYVPLVMAHWMLLENEAFTAPVNSESYRYMSPENDKTDRGFKLWSFKDRLRAQKWGNSSLNNVMIRYAVFYAKASEI